MGSRGSGSVNELGPECEEGDIVNKQTLKWKTKWKILSSSGRMSVMLLSQRTKALLNKFTDAKVVLNLVYAL
jgi:hypothetical protein